MAHSGRVSGTLITRCGGTERSTAPRNSQWHAGKVNGSIFLTGNGTGRSVARRE